MLLQRHLAIVLLALATLILPSSARASTRRAPTVDLAELPLSGENANPSESAVASPSVPPPFARRAAGPSTNKGEAAGEARWEGAEHQRPRLAGGGTADAAVPASLDGQPVALNAGGFVTSMRATSLSWSTRGLLREVQEPVPAELEHYGYDPDLRRTSRHRGTTTEFYVHEGPNRIAVISPGAGAGVGVGALVQGFLFDGIDHPLRIRIPGVGGPAGTTAYYEVDLAGNVRALRASGGASLGGYRYSAFGRTLEDTSSVVQPLRWKGMWHLEVGGTELYDARARVWSPALGSFLAVDEFVFVDRTNTLWAWPNQNPIRFSDPSGHSQPPGGRLDVGLFTSNQINSIFDASGQAAYAASQNWDAGNYATAAFHFSGSISLFEAGIAASLLARRPATSADFAMMACPIDIPAGGAAGAAEAAAADAAIAGHAAKHWPKLSPEQLAAKIAEVRQTGTSIVAPNGNMLTHVKDGTVLIENPATGEAGTIFKPDNTRDFINRWLSENP